MDITIHHSIELNGSAALAIFILAIAIALIAVSMLYPMLMPNPVPPTDPPKGKFGFI